VVPALETRTTDSFLIRSPASSRAIRNLLEGQYFAPVRIIAFNTAEGWSRDVTEEIAAELACADRREMPPSIADFVSRTVQK
jgi:hypothetical protein